MPLFSQVFSEWDMPALRGMWALKEIIFWKLLAQPWLIVLTKQTETALIISVISADVATSWTIIASTSSAHRCDSWNELRDSRRDPNTPKMGNRHQMYLVKAALTWLHSFLFIPCLHFHVYASSLSSPVYHPFHQGFISVGLLSNLTYSLTRPTGMQLLLSHSVMSDSLRPHGLQHASPACKARLSCPSLSPRGCSNSRLLSRWCHPTISSFVNPYASCLHSFPESGSFPMSRLFT